MTNPQTADPRVADLVTAGKIRAAFFLPQFVDEGGELRGLGTGYIGIDLSRALAKRLGIAAEIVGLPTPAKVVESLQSGACDIAFMGIDPTRTAELDFSPAAFQFDYTYMVPAGSGIGSAADADQTGVRVAIVSGHASTLAAKRLIKHATLLANDIPDQAFDLLRMGKVDAWAFPRPVLEEYVTKLPGARLLDNSFGFNRVGIAMRKDQPERLAYLAAFIEEAKASGLIQRIIEDGKLHGYEVAR